MKYERMNLQIIFLILFFVAVVALVFVITILIKEKDLISKDPLRYGMDVHHFESCTCIDTEGNQWQSYENGFMTERRSKNWVNYTELKEEIKKINITKLKGESDNGPA